MSAIQLKSYAVGKNYQIQPTNPATLDIVFSSESQLSTSSSVANSFHQLILRLEETGIVSGLTYAVSPKDATRVYLKFRLSEVYKKYFALLRGFIALGNPLQIDTNNKTGVFSLSIDRAQSTDATTYFDQLFGWLHKEIAFKTSLKEVINFTNKMKEAQNEFYQKLGVLQSVEE